MSNPDWQSVELFMKDFMIKHVIPLMEKTVRSMSEFIESSKKGIGSSISRFLGFASKKKETKAEVVDLPGSPALTSSSIESVQRKLADYLFMLSDFTEAYNQYKAAIKAFNPEKAGKQFASASEFAALTLFFLEPAKKDVETYLENAFSYYIKGTGNLIVVNLY